MPQYVYKELTVNLSISQAAQQHTEQVVRFSDQKADWVYTIPSQPDPTFGVADTGDATLESFFERPIRIATYAWTPGVQLYEYIDPWTAFFNNVRVTNRMNNYNLVRAKLHVKIVLNGNGFYFGRALVSYVPRPTEISGFINPREFYPEDLIRMSQAPHVLLDPTTSQGGEFCLPFFHTANTLNLPKTEFAQMGALYFKELNPLNHSNSSVEPITVSVYAWASDVSLAIPTSTRIGAVLPQMGDEYGLKPVSAPANALARAAGALTSVPGIAPYAKATQEAAKSVSNIASIFGYSRPPTLDAPQTVNPQYVGNIANTNVPEGLTKLTLDAKQEVTVDPRVTGLSNIDELSILSIAKRESYITSFPWSTTSGVDTVLGSMSVSPMTFFRSVSSVVEQREIHLTPVAFAALPFTYWRGSLKFRFQVVASTFHKGRLRIIYDPYVLQSSSVGEYNINYSYVVDIADERDFTLSFGWGQEFGWRRVTSIANTPDPSGIVAGVISSLPDTLGSNGVFSVCVVNELTVPNDACPDNVTVNVFISAGDDFEVCVPSCTNLSTTSYARAPTNPGFAAEEEAPKFEAQMGDVADPADAANDSIPQTEVIAEDLASILPLADHTLDVYFGDPVVSFRQCLKRYQFSKVYPITALGTAADATSRRLVTFTNSTLPLYRGFVSDATDFAIHPTAFAATRYNFVKATLLNYLMPAYAGRRGGIRWKYHVVGMDTRGTSSAIVTDSSLGVGTSSSSEALSSGLAGQPNARVAQWDRLWPHTWCASHVTNLEQKPTLEVEFPYYTARRFSPTRTMSLSTAGNPSLPYHTLRVSGVFGSPDAAAILSYVSVAEDFNLFFFVWVPVMYDYPTPSPWINP